MKLIDKIDLYLNEGEYEVEELFDTITNDGDFYRMKITPLINNLKKKAAKGQYNKSLAVKAFKAIVDAGVKKYAKDFSDSPRSFSSADKQKVAAQMVDYYDEEINESVNEAKGNKPFFGATDGMSYAVNLNGAVGGNSFPNRGFGGIVDNRKLIGEFKKTAKSTHVGAKGKPTLAAVKKWVKENKPSEFYASWKSDSSSWKDDSVEIFYK